MQSLQENLSHLRSPSSERVQSLIKDSLATSGLSRITSTFKWTALELNLLTLVPSPWRLASVCFLGNRGRGPSQGSVNLRMHQDGT